MEEDNYAVSTLLEDRPDERELHQVLAINLQALLNQRAQVEVTTNAENLASLRHIPEFKHGTLVGVTLGLVALGYGTFLELQGRYPLGTALLAADVVVGGPPLIHRMANFVKQRRASSNSTEAK